MPSLLFEAEFLDVRVGSNQVLGTCFAEIMRSRAKQKIPKAYKIWVEK
jgi:hypothetical protein